jgi:hypothetical protein
MSAVAHQPELVSPPYGVPRTLLAFERIVVVIDPSVPHQAGLDKAARIAARTGARLELCVHEPMQQTDDSAFERQFGNHVIRTLPDLVIKEVHGRAGSAPAPTQTDWQLMRQLAAPLPPGFVSPLLATGD